MSDPTHIASEPSSAPLPDVLVLPAEYFFVEQVEVPAAVTSGELADYAELSIEAIAPFPLEQLRWGFLTAPDGQSILIYAALNDRLKRAGYKELESYTWVLPDFATLQGARLSRETQVVFQGEQYDTYCLHPEGEGLPEDVQSLRSDATPVKDPELVERVASTGNSGEANPNTTTPLARDRYRSDSRSAQTLRLRLLPVELSDHGTPIFSFETLGEAPANGHWSPLTPDEASLWHADIRPAGFKSIERSARRTTAVITRIMGYAAIFMLLLILLEGLFFGGELWLDTRKAKIEDQATAVRRVEDKQSLMNKLEQVAQNELRPIAILEAANQIRISLGTSGIEYDEVVIEDGNRITIEGKANTINELNAYTDALRKSGNFQLIDTPKSRTRNSKTTFAVTLDYVHSEAPAEAAPTVAESKESTPEPTETP